MEKLENHQKQDGMVYGVEYKNDPGRGVGEKSRLINRRLVDRVSIDNNKQCLQNEVSDFITQG